MFSIKKYIPKISFTNIILESKLSYTSDINYIIKKKNHFEYLLIDSFINIKLRENENYKINENILIELNTINTDIQVKYAHNIFYNNNLLGKINLSKQNPTIWSNYNSSIKKLYYEIINNK